MNRGSGATEQLGGGRGAKHATRGVCMGACSTGSQVFVAVSKPTPPGYTPLDLFTACHKSALCFKGKCVVYCSQWQVYTLVRLMLLAI